MVRESCCVTAHRVAPFAWRAELLELQHHLRNRCLDQHHDGRVLLTPDLSTARGIISVGSFRLSVLTSRTNLVWHGTTDQSVEADGQDLAVSR